MHVLFIVKYFKSSYRMSADVFTKEQAEAVSKKGVKTGLISVNFVSLRDFFKQKKVKFDFGIKIKNEDGIQSVVYQTILFPFLRNINHIRRNLILKRLSKKYIKNFGKPDICHVHGFYCGAEAVNIKNKYGIPYVITEHNSVFARNLINPMEKKMAVKAFNNSDQRIGVSPELCKTLNKLYNLEFTYLPNIVDTKKFPLKPELKSNSKKFKFISIGSTDKNKNHEMLIRAFANIKEKNKELTIIGSGSMLSRLKNLAEEKQESANIKFISSFDHDKLYEKLNDADVFVLPSLYETFGVVLIEALSCGLPIISTPVGIAPEIIKNKKIGYICSFEESDLTRKMEITINSEFDRQYIRKAAVENFSSEAIAGKLLNLYSSILSKK